MSSGDEASTSSDHEGNVQRMYETNEDQIKSLIDFAQQHKTCLMWEFSAAPPALQWEFGQGGDEDYLAFCPTSYGSAPYLFDSPSFGCCAQIQFNTSFGSFHVGTHA